MFGNDKNNKRHAATRDHGVTILTAGCQFNGRLYCRGSTRIGGVIEGQVMAEGLLVIEEEAKINGEIKAEEVVIHGYVQGTIEAKRRIELCPSGRVHADISSPRLIIQEGAILNGHATMKEEARQDNVTNLGKKGPHVGTPPKNFGKESHKFEIPKDNIAMRVPDIVLPVKSPT